MKAVPLESPYLEYTARVFVSGISMVLAVLVALDVLHLTSRSTIQKTLGTSQRESDIRDCGYFGPISPMELRFFRSGQNWWSSVDMSAERHHYWPKGSQENQQTHR